MIEVRDYHWADYDAIENIHRAMALGYELPDLDSPLLVVKKVCLNEWKEPVGAAILRLTAEAYLLIDPQAEKRAQIFMALHENTRHAARKAGLDDVQALIPPQLERFGRQIMRLGWKKQLWPLYSRETR